MKLHIVHRTCYRYAGSATYSIQILKLTPRRDPSQRALSWRLGTPGRRVEQVDAFGNTMHVLTLEGPHTEVVVHAEGLIETDESCADTQPIDGPLSPLVYATTTQLTRCNGDIIGMAARAFRGEPATRESVMNLLAEVSKAVRYRAGSTLVSDSAIDVITRGEGVCQDQTHVAIAACRAAGLAARYVSGYLHTNDDSQASSHAWMDVWLPGENRWFSCDVTHQRVADGHLCRLAVGRDYLDAAPVRGMRRGGGREELEVQVTIADSTPQQSQHQSQHQHPSPQ